MNIKSQVLKVDNINDVVTPELSNSAKEALKNKVQGTVGEGFAVRYLGLKGLRSEKEDSAKKLAELVNKFCSTYQVRGQLGDFIKYDLAITNTKAESLYLAYMAVTPEAAEVIDKLISLNGAEKGLFNETGLPKAGDSL